MARVIKLTESDLQRIVERVLNEQSQKETPIEPPMQVAVEMRGRRFMTDVTSYIKEAEGCIFLGNRRGEEKTEVSFFECKNKILYVGDGQSKSETLSISQKATDVMNQICGCDSYVKRGGPITQNV
jgi:hypothetical protein